MSQLNAPFPPDPFEGDDHNPFKGDPLSRNDNTHPLKRQGRQEQASSPRAPLSPHQKIMWWILFAVPTLAFMIFDTIGIEIFLGAIIFVSWSWYGWTRVQSHKSRMKFFAFGTAIAMVPAYLLSPSLLGFLFVAGGINYAVVAAYLHEGDKTK